VVAREELASAEVRAMASAVLATVAVACEEEGVGDLSPEFAGDVNEASETNDAGARDLTSFRSEDLALVDLEYLRFSIDDET